MQRKRQVFIKISPINIGLFTKLFTAIQVSMEEELKSFEDVTVTLWRAAGFYYVVYDFSSPEEAQKAFEQNVCYLQVMQRFAYNSLEPVKMDVELPQSAEKVH